MGPDAMILVFYFIYLFILGLVTVTYSVCFFFQVRDLIEGRQPGSMSLKEVI